MSDITALLANVLSLSHSPIGDPYNNDAYDTWQLNSHFENMQVNKYKILFSPS